MTEHYFSETPSGDYRPREIDVILAGEQRSLLTAGSVFSPEHLDRGTEVLLRVLEGSGEREAGFEAEGRGSAAPAILDLGCGWGPIALSAALHHPEAEVWAIDVNERARELVELNAKRLGLTNVRVAAPDDVPEPLRFAAIHSNPPIRIGKQALHAMLTLWLPRLEPGASAHLVVAKHLGADSLQTWIASEFPDLAVDRVARRKGFQVISATRTLAST